MSRNLPWLKETSTAGHLFKSYKGFYALNLHLVNRTSIEQILLRTMAFFCGQTIHFLCGSTKLTFVLCAISWLLYISWLLCIFGCLLGGLAVFLKEIPHFTINKKTIWSNYSDLGLLQKVAFWKGIPSMSGQSWWNILIWHQFKTPPKALAFAPAQVWKAPWRRLSSDVYPPWSWTVRPWNVTGTQIGK